MDHAHGRHCLIDLWGCASPADPVGWEQLLRAAVDAMDATLLDLRVHAFAPHGLTAVAILAESHLAIHTWPERDYVAIDLFTCGDQARPEAAIAHLTGALRPRRQQQTEVPRGVEAAHEAPRP